MDRPAHQASSKRNSRSPKANPDIALPPEKNKFKLWLSYPLAVDIDSYDLSNTPAASVRRCLDHYQFVQCIEHSPLGEVWRVVSPQKQHFLAHFLAPTDPESTDKFIQRFRQIRHSGLTSFEIQKDQGDRVILITPLPGKSLKDRFQEYWNNGMPGIPRRELLQYLHQTALILDEIYQSHRLQHFALNPKNILLNEGQVQLHGFGFAELLWAPRGQPILALNPQYSAPEIFRNRVSPNCDQCSLALIYVALLTGVHPMRNWERAATGQTFPKTLDLSLISTGDRKVVLKAIHSNPRLRYANATAFIEALVQAGETGIAEADYPQALSRLLVQNPRGVGKPIFSLESFVQNLVSLAVDGRQESYQGKVQFHIEEGQRIEHRPGLILPADKLFQRLSQFGKAVSASATHFDDHRILLKVSVPTSFWHSFFKKRIGLEIEVQLLPKPKDQAEMVVVIRPFGCSGEQAVHLLQDEGGRLLEELQKHLNNNRPEMRKQPRFACQKRILLSPVMDACNLAPPIEGITKDISAGGVGIILPMEVNAKHLYVSLPEIQNLAPYAGLTEIVRVQRLNNGWYEIGAAFALDRS